MRRKSQDVLKFFDLFGRPVQLTHKGHSTFRTSLGGCLSLLVIISISVFATIRLREIYFSPHFQLLPTDFDFNQNNVTMDFLTNTLAVKIQAIDSNKNYT